MPTLLAPPSVLVPGPILTPLEPLLLPLPRETPAAPAVLFRPTATDHGPGLIEFGPSATLQPSAQADAPMAMAFVAVPGTNAELPMAIEHIPNAPQFENLGLAAMLTAPAAQA